MDAIRALAALLLICCAVDTLLPASSTRSYARFVMGVVIVVAMAAPLMEVLNAPDVLIRSAMERIDEGVAASISTAYPIRALDERRALAVLEGAGIVGGGAVITYDEEGVERVTLSGQGGVDAKAAAIQGIQVVLNVGEGGVYFE